MPKQYPDDYSISISEHSHEQQEDNEEDDVEDFAVIYTRQVCCMRTIMVLILLSVTAVASFIMYSSTKHAQVHTFDTQYNDNAYKVAETVAFNIDKTIIPVAREQLFRKSKLPCRLHKLEIIILSTQSWMLSIDICWD